MSSKSSSNGEKSGLKLTWVRARNFCYSSHRCAETQTQSKKKGEAEKVCDGGTSFALPSRMVCILFAAAAALFTH